MNRRQFFGQSGVALLAGSVSGSAWSATPAGSPAGSAITNEILAAEMERRRALIDHDLSTLDQLLDDRLCYIHASGLSESKQGFLGHLRAGEVRYIAVDGRSPQVIELAADAGAFTDRLHVVAHAGGKDHPFDLISSGSWTKASGRWRLVMWQSTPARADKA